MVRGRDHEGEGTDESLSSPKVRKLGLTTCVRGEGVQGVLTLICGGVAQTCHDDRAVELRVQLGVEDVERKDWEEQVEVEENRLKEMRPCI